MQKTVVMNHPLIQHKIGILRRTETGSKDFRELISEIAMYMCYEATRDLKLKDVEIETPICRTTVKELSGKKLAVVPILRAGLGMVDGMLAMIPAAKVGHIGLYRDPKTLEPVEYYCKLPADSDEREVFVVDPMLATGGSSVAAIQMLKDKGVKNIRFMCIIAAPEGVERMQKTHPDVDLYIGALDDHLNEHGYIVPGLGDAGDRIFGTK
ncbi:MAG TPA: uracil phosphoribosyltransferase [Candidatus Choladousia intestinigallinarum]|nr:uracil phosphoribosyltransferase [Candidatus Choladousia intestinigallinarum]